MCGVGFAVEVVVLYAGVLHKIKSTQSLWVLSLSFAVLQMCVCGAWTHVVCIRKASLSVFSGAVVLS